MSHINENEIPVYFMFFIISFRKGNVLWSLLLIYFVVYVERLMRMNFRPSLCYREPYVTYNRIFLRLINFLLTKSHNWESQSLADIPTNQVIILKLVLHRLLQFKNILLKTVQRTYRVYSQSWDYEGWVHVEMNWNAGVKRTITSKTWKFLFRSFWQISPRFSHNLLIKLLTLSLSKIFYTILTILITWISLFLRKPY